MDYKNTLSICTLEYLNESGPNIISALTVDEIVTLIAYIKSQRLNSIGKHHFPLKVNAHSDINNIIDEMELLNTEQLSSKTDSALITLRLNLILLLLQSLKIDFFKFCNAVKFTHDQLNLMTKLSISYSYDLVFSSIIFNILPQTYQFLRRSGHCILPRYSTIRKITLSSSLSPSVKQSDKMILFYIKQKFRNLFLSDFTVMFLVDEIHLKSFFDYKGGNIVGTSFNCPSEAAKPAFTFMISSVVSAYKDVVHLLPTRKVTTDDLHEMIEKIVVA